MSAGDDPKSCNCTPSYYGVAWDRAARKQRKTRRFRGVMEARNARKDLADALGRGTALSVAGPRLAAAREEFVAPARDGIALNKWGRRYRTTAWKDLDGSLRSVPDELARRRLGDLSRGDIQRLVDDMARAGASGSRIRSVVSCARSTAGRRTASSSATTGRERPAAGDGRDATRSGGDSGGVRAAARRAEAGGRLPWALAGYATARKQEIRVLDWSHVDLKLGAVELAADEEGRKPGGSWRVVPLVKPLHARLREAWIAQGRPTNGKVCPPRQHSPSGMLALGDVQERVHREWRTLGLEPIGVHESRHTAATWLDHAGVSPKVASTLMGHRTPEYQPGAASITLRRYTHTLPGELERARDLLDRFLAERTAAEATG